MSVKEKGMSGLQLNVNIYLSKFFDQFCFYWLPLQNFAVRESHNLLPLDAMMHDTIMHDAMMYDAMMCFSMDSHNLSGGNAPNSAIS